MAKVIAGIWLSLSVGSMVAVWVCGVWSTWPSEGAQISLASVATLAFIAVTLWAAATLGMLPHRGGYRGKLPYPGFVPTLPRGRSSVRAPKQERQ